MPAPLTPAPTRYSDPRAHELRAAYLATFPADEIPVPVESIAEDLLGLRIEERDLAECSGMLIPSERLIVVSAAETTNGDVPTRRHRFTIAHELGHWICHALEDVGKEQPTYCRSRDLAQDAEASDSRGVGCGRECGGSCGAVRGVGAGGAVAVVQLRAHRRAA